MQLRMQRDGRMLGCSKFWGSWKWAYAWSTQPHLGHPQEVGPVTAPGHSSAQQPRWETPLVIYHFLSLLTLLSLWHCSGLRHLAPGHVGTSSRSPVWPEGSCPSRQVLARGCTVAQSKDKMLDFSTSFVWLLFIIRLYFLANKNYFQPFFHWLVLFCL